MIPLAKTNANESGDRENIDVGENMDEMIVGVEGQSLAYNEGGFVTEASRVRRVRGPSIAKTLITAIIGLATGIAAGVALGIGVSSAVKRSEIFETSEPMVSLLSGLGFKGNVYVC